MGFFTTNNSLGISFAESKKNPKNRELIERDFPKIKKTKI
jgi:hypothetical protein